uniref:PSP proline-rich domain-containing protein n=1 Tax=Strigamia maritima TaxID=126957 RepID=T1JLP0_STRMM
MEMRQAVQEKEDEKTLKSRMKEKVRPKMGKIDMDYQKLHDAFFKYQTKPKLTGHGDLYYEGKEFETRYSDKQPGEMSDQLKTALGMPVGPNSNRIPPLWLIMMQRFGPPPSFPNLKIPGLNALVPKGCAFGYEAGQWGKPPVDETGKPLYGDVFGEGGSQFTAVEEVDRTLWGEMTADSESEEDDDDDDEKEDDDKDVEVDNSGLETPVVGGSSVSQVEIDGLETPDAIEFRKRKIESEISAVSGGPRTERKSAFSIEISKTSFCEFLAFRSYLWGASGVLGPGAHKMEECDAAPLYAVLPEKTSARNGGAMMASTHVYDVSAAVSKASSKGIAVSLDPSDLGDAAAVAAKCEMIIREENRMGQVDLSDMVAEHVAEQSFKRKKKPMDNGKGAKKYKEFKF